MSRIKGRKRSLLPEISRRQLLRMGLITVASGLIPGRAMAAVNRLAAGERSVCIYNLHTNEYLDVVYWRDGKYLPEAFRDINHVFRDHYNGAVKPIDKKLIDFLYSIQSRLDCNEPIHLISGYRSPATNARLRKKSNGVARRSLHIMGQAADIRMPGYQIKTLRSVAYNLQNGGVGYYPRSNFLHVDVGRVRFWRG